MEQRSALTELLRRSREPADWGGQKYTLWIHDDNVSTFELILNPELFPSAREGDCVALLNVDTNERVFVLSLHKTIADTFEFHTRREILVKLLPLNETPMIESVTVNFRDQYIGRVPMRQIKQYILGGGAYIGKRIEIETTRVRARIVELNDKDGKRIHSGVLPKEGLIIKFRSETAKFFILIQISKESREWDSLTGMTFLEKAVDDFLADLFDNWKQANVNHLVSIILFCRSQDDAGNNTKDYYSVVIDREVYDDWRITLRKIRKEANDLITMITARNESLTMAMNGNVLEAIHLALMIFDKHYLDRDLIKTGMSIVCITPGSGYFKVTHKQSYAFCRLAKRKVLDSGIWLQLVCLDKAPFHSSPLIKIGEHGDYYEPYWMTALFFNGHRQWRQDGDYIIKNESIVSGIGDPISSASTVSLPSLLSADHGSPFSRDSAVFNPCDPFPTNFHHCLICSHKWGIVPDQKGALISRLQSPIEFGWETLVIPPCLPLVFPLRIDKSTFMGEFGLTEEEKVRLSHENLLFAMDANSEDLMDELICLRLALGFQEITIEGILGKAMVFAHEIHLIDLVDNQVTIGFYKRKTAQTDDAKQDLDKIPYKAYIRSKLHGDFLERSFMIQPSPLHHYPWGQVDRMIAGDDQNAILSATYWQSRFVLVPAQEAPRTSLIMAMAANEILDDEELRIAGFFKFIELFQRIAVTKVSPSNGNSSSFLPMEEKDLRRSAIEFLNITLTTSSCSAFAHQEFTRKSIDLPATAWVPGNEEDNLDFVADVEPLTRMSEMRKIAVLMQHPLVGINIKNRRWHWKMYRNVFVGSETIDWIMKFFDDIKTREEAVDVGNLLLDQGVWEHIFGTHRFLDGYYYYRFSAEYDIGTLRQSNPNILKIISSKEVDGDNAEEDDVDIEPKSIVMSRSILIDVDNRGRAKKKREWAILHYDSTHNPKNTYHFRLNWLTCSPLLIDNLIQAWVRRASQCGFLLIEAPIDYHTPKDDEIPSGVDRHFEPFYRPIIIEFSVNPPSARELNDRIGSGRAIVDDFFVSELLSKHNFVLDLEDDKKYPSPTKSVQCTWSYDRKPQAFTQYIHQSGVAIIQINPHGLLWSTNRLFLSSITSRSIRGSPHRSLTQLEERLRNEMILFCSNPITLGTFWRETLHLLGKKVGIESILDDIPDSMTEGSKDSVGSPEDIFDRIALIGLDGSKPIP